MFRNFLAEEERDVNVLELLHTDMFRNKMLETSQKLHVLELLHTDMFRNWLKESYILFCSFRVTTY